MSIISSNSTVMAGWPLSLNCSASVQEGISGTPTLTWTKDGDDLPSEANAVPPLLSFSSLRTSHAGRYTCTARLNIPVAGVDVSGANTANVSIQSILYSHVLHAGVFIFSLVPQPMVTITGSPRNMTFFPGLIQTFTCLVAVHPAVDTPIRVQGSWERNETPLRDSGDSQKTVTNEFMEASPNSYEITVVLNPMNFDDTGTYQCSAAVIPQESEFVTEQAMLTSNQRTVYVQGMSLVI